MIFHSWAPNRCLKNLPAMEVYRQRLDDLLLVATYNEDSSLGQRFSKLTFYSPSNLGTP